MVTFDQAVQIIIDIEGGLVSDSGGLTKYGISQRAYPDLDINSLTEDQAKEIYYRDYWLPSKCDVLPSPLNLFVFDCAVNQGKNKAAVTLQKALGVKADGIIGQNTLNAANNVTFEQVTKFMAIRAVTYASLSTFELDGLGWMKRLFTVTLKSQQNI